MKSSSICIIGAGPAGLSASLFLSKAGIEHILIDRSSFPRDKVCGESFDGKVYHTLNRLDPDWLPELENRGMLQKCRTYSLTNSWGNKFVVQYPQEATPKIHIKRRDFDDFLLTKANISPQAHIFLNTKAQKFFKKENSIQIQTNKGLIQSDLLILCSGARSLIRSIITRPEKIKDRFLFARAYFKDIKKVSEQEELEIFFLRNPFKGCLLFCPVSAGEVNVEIGMHYKEWKRHQLPMDALLLESLKLPHFQSRFSNALQTAKIKSTAMNLSTAPRIYSQERILMAGAATGSLNPITGYGVGHAMVMGRLAAQQAALAIKKQKFNSTFLKGYDAQVKAKLQKEILLSNMLTKLQKRIDILEPLIYLLSKGHTISNILKDKNLAENVLNPRFYWKHWRSANSKKI